MIIVFEHAIFQQRMDKSRSDGIQIDAWKPIFVTPILHNDMDTKDYLDNRKWCLLASTYLSTALVQVVGVCCLHKTEKPRKKIYATAIGNVLNGTGQGLSHLCFPQGSLDLQWIQSLLHSWSNILNLFGRIEV